MRKEVLADESPTIPMSFLSLRQQNPISLTEYRRSPSASATALRDWRPGCGALGGDGSGSALGLAFLCAAAPTTIHGPVPDLLRRFPWEIPEHDVLPVDELRIVEKHWIGQSQVQQPFFAS